MAVSFVVVRRLAAIFLSGALVCTAAAAPVVSFGPDTLGVGRVLTQVSPAGAAVPLGDGTTAYNGGLAYRASDASLYAIANDAFGASRLVRIDPATPGSATGGVAIGTGFYGGLAIGADGRFYGIASDFSGASTLFGIDPLSGATTSFGVLGFGFYGGLAFDDASGALYAIAGDDFGVARRFDRIDFGSGGATATTLFDLGDGSLAFNGGLAWDATAGRFDVIGSDFVGTSSLFAFDPTSAASLTTLDAAFGTGFVNAGLAFLPAALGPGGGGGGTVPEPAVPALVAIAVLAAVAGRRRAGGDASHPSLRRTA